MLMIVCTVITIILMFVILKENLLAFTIFLQPILERITFGNIDPFVFLVIVICLCLDKYEYYYTIPVLLGFICFKPTVILILSYFFLSNKRRFAFVLLFTSTFFLFNIEFLLSGYQNILSFITTQQKDYALKYNMGTHFRYWFWYVCYYGFRNEIQDLIHNYNFKLIL